MKKMLYIAVLAAAAAAACNKIEENTPDPVSFKASISDTKTTLVDGKKTEWMSGDAISVFGEAEHGYYFSTATDGATATFQTTETVESGLVASLPYALYPYNYDSTVDGSVITTFVDNNQTPSAGDFSSQKPILVARGDAEGNLTFSHTLAVIKFTITDENITSVTFKGNSGEYIAGTVKVDAADGTAAVDTEADWKETSVYLAHSDGAALAAGTYYFTIVPTSFDGGITLSWTPEADGKDNWKSTTQKVVTKAGRILNLGTVGYTDTDTEAPEVEQISEDEATLDGESVSYRIQIKVTDNKALKWIKVTGWEDFGDYNQVFDDIEIDENTLQGASEYTFEKDLTLTALGTYKFWVTAYDRSGNAFDAEAGSVTVKSSSDTEAPAITVTSSKTAAVGTDYTLTIQFDDPSGIAGGWFSVSCWETVNGNWTKVVAGTGESNWWTENGGYTIPSDAGTSWSHSWVIQFPEAGTYALYVGTVSDRAGNSFVGNLETTITVTESGSI